MIRALLVDDQPLVREGLHRILGFEEDIGVVGEASDGAEALAILERCRHEKVAVDVVLMDIRMRGMDGVTATRAIRDQAGPPVLVLTTFDDDETLWGAIDAGAAGFVLKEAPGEDLVRATRTVGQGGSWLDPAVTDRVLAASRQPGSRPLTPTVAELLTDREREVLVLMASGATNGEIAARLHIGAATIKSHVGSIFSKLGVRDRAGAIVFAYQHGLAQVLPPR